MMDEQDFKKRADEALTALHRALIGAADDFGFDVDFNSGALGIEFEDLCWRILETSLGGVVP